MFIWHVPVCFPIFFGGTCPYQRTLVWEKSLPVTTRDAFTAFIQFQIYINPTYIQRNYSSPNMPQYCTGCMCWSYQRRTQLGAQQGFGHIDSRHSCKLAPAGRQCTIRLRHTDRLASRQTGQVDSYTERDRLADRQIDRETGRQRQVDKHIEDRQIDEQTDWDKTRE